MILIRITEITERKGIPGTIQDMGIRHMMSRIVQHRMITGTVRHRLPAEMMKYQEMTTDTVTTIRQEMPTRTMILIMAAARIFLLTTIKKDGFLY